MQSLPASSNVLAAVTSLPTDATIAAAATQLSGQLYASTQTALLGESRSVRDALLGRLRQADSATADRAGTQVHGGITLWAHAVGAWSHHNATADAARMNDNLKGVMLGLDHSWNDHAWLGASAGFTHSSINIDQHPASATSHNVDIGMYGGLRADAFSLLGGLAYTRQKLSSQRQITIPGLAGQATSDYSAKTTQVFADAGYRFEFARTSLTPFVRAAWVKLQTDGFDEHGSGAALVGASAGKSMGVATLGLRATTRFALTHGTLTLHEKLGWQDVLGQPDATTSLAFQQGQAFTVEGVGVADSAAVAGVGLGYQSGHGFSLDASWTGWLASSAKVNQFSLRLAWSF
ncbi:MAG TPA: autotransporter outer membrane beta-barrel domain-containing protein [Rhodanobacteraceae bacterium]